MPSEIIVDREMLDHLITIISVGVGVIVSLIGALIAVHQQLISKKISACNEVICTKIDGISEFTHETRRLVYDSHNRISDHIDTHHTKRE